MILIYGALSMILAPVMAEAASLNHYSDYGVLEQSDSTYSSKISINNDPFGYSDAYTDNETGMQYLQVRYYNPLIMRFTQMDTYPLLNRYAYADENPIMNDDPTGHNAEATGNSSSQGTGTSQGFGDTGLVLGGAMLSVTVIASELIRIVGTAYTIIPMILSCSSLITGGFSHDNNFNSATRGALGITSFITGLSAVAINGVSGKKFFDLVNDDIMNVPSSKSITDPTLQEQVLNGIRGSSTSGTNCVARAISESAYLTKGLYIEAPEGFDATLDKRFRMYMLFHGTFIDAEDANASYTQALEEAKKQGAGAFLIYLKGNDVGHAAHIITQEVENGGMQAVFYDPPFLNHEETIQYFRGLNVRVSFIKKVGNLINQPMQVQEL